MQGLYDHNRCPVSLRSFSRRTRSQRAAVSRILLHITTPCSALLVPPPFSSGDPLIDMAPFPPPPNQHRYHNIATPLDRIDVSALDLEALIAMESSLRLVLAPIMSLDSFTSLLLPDKIIPRYAPTSIIAHEDWAKDLVSWDIATPVRKWDSRAMMQGFAVPKADGTSARFILDASALNKAMLRPPSFRLPTLAEMRPVIFSYSAGQITDLRHCFYQFPVHEDIALYFCLHARGEVLSFKRMAMGWSWAPSIAQATARAYLNPVGAAGLAIYDDFLCLGHSVEQCAAHTQLLRARIISCGGTIHPRKSAPSPTTRTTFCGIEWDLATKCHRLDPKMVSKWVPWLRVIAQGRSLPLRYYWIALGVATYVQRTLLVAPATLNKLFSWAAQTASQLSRGLITWSTHVTPWQAATSEWGAITGHLLRNAWVQFHVSPIASPILFTDSSLTGWAWLLHSPSDPSVMGMRGGWAPGPHINVLELLTVWKALRWLCPRLPGFTWELSCDNSTVVHQLRRGRTANHLANRILLDLAFLLQQTKSQVRPRWVSTHNQLADAHTRLHLRSLDLPEAFGTIPAGQPQHPATWPLLLRPFLASATTTTTSSDVPLGFLPTGI